MASYCLSADRTPESVRLIAVSKTKPAADIAEAYRAGLRHFGENYCQEAIGKQSALGAYDITWHFIGPIQSNKTKLIAANFAWVHSVDSLRIASRLNDQRPDAMNPLNICLQVNISGEDSKSGVDLADLAGLSAEVSKLPRLNLRGVMAIPAPEHDYERQRSVFRNIREAVSAINSDKLCEFSFGMSGDLKAAITEGATMVRIGTAIFGYRQ
jgi:pyridoxal phosphate enzyme (YggS family)